MDRDHRSEPLIRAHGRLFRGWPYPRKSSPTSMPFEASAHRQAVVPGRSVLKVHRDGSWKLVHAVGAIQATSKSADVAVPNKDGYAIRLCLLRYLN
jgi:hypothetical protein